MLLLCLSKLKFLCVRVGVCPLSYSLCAVACTARGNEDEEGIRVVDR